MWCHGLTYCISYCNEGSATLPNRGWSLYPALSNGCPVQAWLANHADHRTPSTTAAWHTWRLWSSNHLCLGASRSSQVAAAQGTLELVSLWSLSQDSRGCRCESPGFQHWNTQNDSGQWACLIMLCAGKPLTLNVTPAPDNSGLSGCACAGLMVPNEKTQQTCRALDRMPI